MHPVFLIVTFMHVSPADHVVRIPWRLPGVVTLSECIAMLEAEPVYDTTILGDYVNIDTPETDPRMVVHSLRRELKWAKEDWAKSGKPYDVVLSCEEIPDPWGMIVDP
jgi:hypothetical protein